MLPTRPLDRRSVHMFVSATQPDYGLIYLPNLKLGSLSNIGIRVVSRGKQVGQRLQVHLQGGVSNASFAQSRGFYDAYRVGYGVGYTQERASAEVGYRNAKDKPNFSIVLCTRSLHVGEMRLPRSVPQSLV